jgi:uncharacterized membrane protein
LSVLIAGLALFFAIHAVAMLPSPRGGLANTRHDTRHPMLWGVLLCAAPAFGAA